MSENKNRTVNETLPQEKLSINYILEQIEAIQSQTDYLQNVITSLAETHSGGPGDTGAQERARALGEVIVSRETTNQKLIAFYERLYDDLKPDKAEALVNLLLDTMDDSRLPEGMRECVEQHLHNVLSELSMNLSR